MNCTVYVYLYIYICRYIYLYIDIYLYMQMKAAALRADMEENDEDGGDDDVLSALMRLRCLSRTFSGFDSAGTSISGAAARE